MPKAIGEFGRSKNSETSNKVIEYLNTVDMPQTLSDIWKHVVTDLDRMQLLQDITTGLVRAGKIQHVKNGFLPVKKVFNFEQRYFDINLIGGM